jgi:hypothetical protein
MLRVSGYAQKRVNRIGRQWPSQNPQVYDCAERETNSSTGRLDSANKQ